MGISEEQGAVQTEPLTRSLWKDVGVWQSSTVPSHSKCSAVSPSRTTNNEYTAAFENLFSAKHRQRPLPPYYLDLITAHVRNMQNR